MAKAQKGNATATVPEDLTQIPVEELIARLNASQADREKLKAQADEAETLKQIHAAVLAENERLAKDLSEAAIITDELQAQLTETQIQKGGSFPAVKYEGSYYQFMAAKVKIADRVYTAAEVKADEKLVKLLIESGSEILAKAG